MLVLTGGSKNKMLNVMCLFVACDLQVYMFT